MINITYSSSLSSYITPFKVWFRRKPLWHSMPSASTSASRITSSLIAIVLGEVEDNTNNKANILPEREETDINEDYMLLELYYWVFLYNAKKARKLAYRGGENLIYKASQIVLLAIPHKNRLLIEATRLPCRILIVIKGVYTLLS